MYIRESKDVYHFLEQRKDEIEKELGYELEWKEQQPNQKMSRAKVEFPCFIDNTDEWEQYFELLQKTAEQFQTIFSKHLKEYK